MLDVHVIISPYTRRDWLDECLSSIQEARRRAAYAIKVHVAPYHTGHIGKGRAEGYTLGKYPYVTYVDDDDYLLPSAFDALDEALLDLPDAIFCAESTLQNGNLLDGPKRHHLCVYRREHLIDHTQWVVCGDVAQMHAVDGKYCIDISSRNYVHRIYQSGGRALRRKHHDELRSARG